LGLFLFATSCYRQTSQNNPQKTFIHDGKNSLYVKADNQEKDLAKASAKQ
jgi:hypothetical protein